MLAYLGELMKVTDFKVSNTSVEADLVVKKAVSDSSSFTAQQVKSDILKTTAKPKPSVCLSENKKAYFLHKSNFFDNLQITLQKLTAS